MSNALKTQPDDQRTYRWLVDTFSKDSLDMGNLQDRCEDVGYKYLVDVPLELAEAVLAEIRK